MKTKSLSQIKREIKRALNGVTEELDKCYRASQPNIYKYAVDYAEARGLSKEITHALEDFAEEVQENLTNELLQPAYDKLDQIIKDRLTDKQAWAEWVSASFEKQIEAKFDELDLLFEKFQDGYIL